MRPADILEAWDLTPEASLAAGASAARLLAVRCADGTKAVLKLARPGQGLESEILALSAQAGRGVAPLLRHDAAAGALLLRRVVPGTKLRALAMRDDDAATLAAARLIADLPCPPPPGAVLAEAAGWSRAIATVAALPSPPLPRSALDRAGGLLRELMVDAPPALLLHGDLHHDNILADEAAGWLTVDPKGLLGEPAAEAACLLRNPADPALLARAPRRIAILAEVTGLPRERLTAWGYVGTVIAACWAVQDGTDPSPWMEAERVICERALPSRALPPGG